MFFSPLSTLPPPAAMHSLFILASFTIANLATPVVAHPPQEAADRYAPQNRNKIRGCLILKWEGGLVGEWVRVFNPGQHTFETNQLPRREITVEVDERCNKKSISPNLQKYEFQAFRIYSDHLLENEWFMDSFAFWLN